MGWVTHSFLVIPECPAPLLGRDLLTKLGAQISFKPDGPEVTYSKGITTLTLRIEDEHRIFETPQDSCLTSNNDYKNSLMLGQRLQAWDWP